MKQFTVFSLAAFAALASFAACPTGGFVFRARIQDASGAPLAKNLSVPTVLKLYPAAVGGNAVWTGQTTVTPMTNGLFQIWVSDDLRSDSSATAATLDEVLENGTASYLGVAFDGGSEIVPRRALVATPLVERASRAAKLDPDAAIDSIQPVTGDGIFADSVFAENVVVRKFLPYGDNLRLNVAEVNVYGTVTLRGNADNKIWDRTPAARSSGTLADGTAITNVTGSVAFLTIVAPPTAPCLTFPVPPGEAFVWRSEPVEASWYFTRMGQR